MTSYVASGYKDCQEILDGCGQMDHQDERARAGLDPIAAYSKRGTENSFFILFLKPEQIQSSYVELLKRYRDTDERSPEVTMVSPFLKLDATLMQVVNVCMDQYSPVPFQLNDFTTYMERFSGPNCDQQWCGVQFRENR